MSAAARANMMVKRNAAKKAAQDQKAAFNDTADDLVVESYPECVGTMSDELKDIMLTQMTMFRTQLDEALHSEEEEALLRLEEIFEKTLYNGFVMGKGFYALNHDPLEVHGHHSPTKENVEVEVVEVLQEQLPFPLGPITAVLCIPFPVEICKTIIENVIFQNMIVAAILLAGFLVGTNTYLDCGFPEVGTCWSDQFGEVLMATRPCFPDSTVGEGGSGSWAAFDEQVYVTNETICHAQQCCFDAAALSKETNCWKRETIPECFSGPDIDDLSHVIEIIDRIILYIFTLECTLTIIAQGRPFWRYFFNPWNLFDFIVVVLCYVDIGGNPAVLRLLRLMRVIKLLKFVEELQLILMGLIAGLQSLGYIMILLVMAFYLFAIMAIMYFKGNDILHFENLEVAMISLFRIATMEDWTDIMYINMVGCMSYGYYGGSYCHDEEFCDVAALCTDANSKGTGFFSVIFFILFTLISGYVIMSLFIGVICDAMQIETEKHRKIKLEAKQKATKIEVLAELEERRANRVTVVSSTDLVAPLVGGVDDRHWAPQEQTLQKDLTAPTGEPVVSANVYIRFATHVAKFVDESTSSGKWFGNATLVVIIIAAVLIGAQTYKSLENNAIVGPFMNICDLIILIYFTVECILKIIARKGEPWMYFTEGWNIFDFIVVAACYMPFGGSTVAVLRLMRLLRVTKLFKSLTQLQIIMNGLVHGMTSIGYIGMLMSLMFYVFGIIGIQIFRANDPVHFGSLHLTFVTLFRCATFEDWTDVMYVAQYGCNIYSYGYFTHRCENNESWGLWSPLYFITFIVFSALIMLNLVIGSICGAMDDAQEDASFEKEQLATIQRVVDETNDRGMPYRIPGVERETILRWMKGFQRMDSGTDEMDKEAAISKEDLDIVLELIGEHNLLTDKRRQHMLLRANHTLPIGWIDELSFIQSLADDLLDSRVGALRQTTGYVVVEQALGLDTDHDFFSDTIDPFCVLYLNGKVIGETQKLSHSGEDPHWNEYVAFPASYLKVEEPNTLRLELFDFDTFTRDDLLGYIEIQDEVGVPWTDRSQALLLLNPFAKNNKKFEVQGSIKFNIIMPTGESAEPFTTAETTLGYGFDPTTAVGEGDTSISRTTNGGTFEDESEKTLTDNLL
jgi:voltage-gated sodium channel